MMSLRSLRPIWIALALATSTALASGRAGWRVEVQPDGFSLRAYAEETLFELFGFELTAGLDLRYPEAEITPYTALLYEGAGWWMGLELAKPIPGAAFRFAVMGGVVW